MSVWLCSSIQAIEPPPLPIEVMSIVGRWNSKRAATLSSDAVVHQLYADPEVRAAVVERWGAEVAPDGVVDRPAVARRAFSAPAERSWLESFGKDSGRRGDTDA